MPTISDVKTSYKFEPRSLGLSWDPCFVCAERPLGDGRGEGSCHENMSAFVQSRAEGEAVVALFTDLGLVASLDFREFEPNWVQVKMGVCRAHQASLRLLKHLTDHAGEIDSNTISYCLPKARVPRDRR